MRYQFAITKNCYFTSNLLLVSIYCHNRVQSFTTVGCQNSSGLKLANCVIGNGNEYQSSLCNPFHSLTGDELRVILLIPSTSLSLQEVGPNYVTLLYGISLRLGQVKTRMSLCQVGMGENRSFSKGQTIQIYYQIRTYYYHTNLNQNFNFNSVSRVSTQSYPIHRRMDWDIISIMILFKFTTAQGSLVRRNLECI